MEYRASGTKYQNIGQHDIVMHKPFNYKKYGLLKQLLPKVITNTTNTTTRLVLDFVEHSMLFLISYVDELKNFKNPNFKLH